MNGSVFLSNLHYFCAQTDGAYKFPNSAEGDLLKRAKIEVEALQRENAALRNRVASLENQSLWKCTCGGTDCEGQKENKVLRSLLREAITEHVDPYDLPEGDDYIARVKTALGEGQP